MTHTFPKDFSEPVLALISVGEKAARSSKWPDYMELGIASEHIPELIRILEKVEAFWPEEETNAPEVYAPIHAWRALGQLKAEQAISFLIDLIIWNEEGDMDWIMEEVPDVIGMIGPVSIPVLEENLLNLLKLEWAPVTIAHCLKEVGQQHPQSRAACVKALEAGLERYATNDENVNGFLISYLADLKAVESVSLVEQAFQADMVDFSVQGDFEDFQIEVGLLEKRLTPPPRFQWAPDPQAEWDSDKNKRREEERRQREQEKKAKKKQKQAKKARKKGKKK